MYSFVLFSFSAEVDFGLEDEWSFGRKRCYCPTSFYNRHGILTARYELSLGI
jgi:hypothetical protein